MFEHILVATDGSALADKAIAMALSIAGGGSDAARISALMVAPDYTADVFEGTARSAAALDDLRQRTVEETRGRLAAALAKHEGSDRIEPIVAVSGFAYHEIVKAAERLSCDLIVMAARGRGPLKAALLGSQTSHVLALAPVPVLVVK